MLGPDISRSDFAAKVRWRMAFDRNPLFPVLQDKLASKSYARERHVESAQVLWAGTDPDAIPFDDLPSRCFLKTNHGCRWNILILDGQPYDYGHGQHLCDDSGRLLDRDLLEPYALSREATRAHCRRLLNEVFSTEEWAYSRIPPRIFVEEALQPATGATLTDYRLYTFGGRVRALSLGSPGYRKRRWNIFLTPQWEEIPLTAYREALPEPRPPKPDALPELIAAAERLGRGIDFVRVDLYDTTNGLRLGELTLYPQAGKPGTPTYCSQFNHWLADGWDVPGALAVNP